VTEEAGVSPNQVSPGEESADLRPPDPPSSEEQRERISWLELFFDLIAVAAVAVLTEGLREDATATGAGMFLVLFTAIWLAWITVVLYANVAGEKTGVRTVLIAMVLFAIMAGAAPNQFEARANLFAGAFLIVRALVARASLRTGKLLTSWPMLQLGGLGALWIAAFWVPTPAKFWVWAAALILDLLLTVARGDGDPDQVAETYNQRIRQRVAKRNTEDHELRRSSDRTRRAREQRGEDPSFEVEAVDVDTSHLDERMGVFIIIVLGEAVMGLVQAAAATEWARGFVITVLLAFAVLVSLWWLTFSYGFAAAPHTRLATLPPRFGLPLHLMSSTGIVLLAAGLDELAVHPDEELTTSLAWISCAGLSLYFAVSAIGALGAKAPLRWILGWGVPCALAPLILAPFAHHMRPEVTAGLLLVIVWWQVSYSLSARGRELGAGRRPPRSARA
jgi:low temperature requirement protein LtrA